MIQLLSALANISAPSGEEMALGNFIANSFSGMDIKIDAHGTLIVHKKGTGSPIVFATGMDTPCVFITSHDKEFARIMPTDDFSVPDGAILQTRKGQKAVIGKDSVGQYADSGSLLLPIGERLVPAPSIAEITDGRFAGFSIGQYAAITAVMAAAKANTKREAYFVFGTKTKIRQFSPAFLQSIQADMLISVEVSLANDAPAEKNVFLSLGDGTALRVKDVSMLSAPDLIEMLENTPYRTKREVSLRRGVGGTLQKAYGGILSAGIGIPTRHIGTIGEMIDIHDVENTSNILINLLQQ